MEKGVIGKLDTLMENHILSYVIPASHTWLPHHHAMTYLPPIHGKPILML